MGKDRILGIGLLVVLIPLTIETFYFPVRVNIPLGVSFWPRLIILLLAILAVYFIVKDSIDGKPADDLNRKAFGSVGFAFVYVLLLETIGFLILTPVFLFAGCLILGGHSDRKWIIRATILAVLGTVFTYVIFHNALLVQLPEGLLYSSD